MRPSKLLRLLPVLLLLLSACAAHRLTVTLGKSPVFIEPAVKQAAGAPPGEAIGPRAFGFNGFELYNRGGFVWRLADQVRDMQELGVGFLRLSGGTTPAWAQVQPGKSAGYDFSRYDRFCQAFSRAGVEMMISLTPQAPWDGDECQKPNRRGPMFPCNLDAYLAYVRAVVKRYDGEHADCGCSKPAPDCYRDGDRQRPKWGPKGRPHVKYWQIGNEVDIAEYWADTPERYAELLQRSYRAIKEVCPDCQVLMGGQSGGGVVRGGYELSPFYRRVLESLRERAFDIVDNHFYKRQGDYPLYAQRQDDYLVAMAARGWARPQFWLTEMDTYSGRPVGAPPQSEADQAAELVRRYVSLFGAGVRKVCWTKMVESAAFHGKPCSYYDFTGLIHNPLAPEDCGDKAHPAGFGVSGRKLSFYSLKLLIEKLSGSPYDGVRLVYEAEGVHVYEFRRPQGPLYVAWWDWYREGEGGKATKTVNLRLPDIVSDKFTVTTAVPDAPTGAGLPPAAYPAFFKREAATLH
jgi:hypothetical protein